MKTIKNYINEVLVHGDFGKNPTKMLIDTGNVETRGRDYVYKYFYNDEPIFLDSEFVIDNDSIIFVQSALHNIYIYTVAMKNVVMTFSYYRQQGGKYKLSDNYYIYDIKYNNKMTDATLAKKIYSSNSEIKYNFDDVDKDSIDRLIRMCKEIRNEI